ncbi:unnamed protein product, partial [Mesorhabditis belari]|uniref:Ubiquitin-like protease family profile domain-containing protein n=1 Tax=Mesorhabditis belari TaxID=2138241 RepID=A0AAF3EY27_9BILA
MEVSTQSHGSPFGWYSDHQGVSYEEEFDQSPTYDKVLVGSFGSSLAFSTSLSAYNPLVGGSVGDEDDAMSYDDACATSSSASNEIWDEEMRSESEQDVFSISQSESTFAKDSRISLLTAATEMLRIRFPFLSISVRLADFLCLQEKELLNDTIVDFFLNHIVEHLLPDEPDKRVTVLPAVFWHNLSIRQSFLPEDFTTLPPNQQEDARFGDVLEFLEDFELFDVDYLVIPVNEWEHWSLLIVCHPFTDRGTTVCFDSQLGDDPNNLAASAKLIEQFLDYSWTKRSGKVSKMPALKLSLPIGLPQQTNAFDCGIFALEYAKKFLLQTPQQPSDFNFSIAYPDFNIKGKRKEVQKTILSLTANRQMWTPLMDLLEKNASRHPSRD